MNLWKHSRLDGVLLSLSITQFIITINFALYWDKFTFWQAIVSFIILTLMITYNIIVISHLFTHTGWFKSSILNFMVSMLNTINIGQSVFAYHLSHVRNHHRHNNDRKNIDGTTKDLSSTFLNGKEGEHASLFRYAFIGALETLIKTIRNILSVYNLWGISASEMETLTEILAPGSKRTREIRQIRVERMIHSIAICLFIAISWKWALLCYLPAFYLALSFVNVQNYYEHFGAIPENKFANSISYYGRLYNLLTFNDGYHQEHHLRPGEHWSAMPKVYHENKDALDTFRIISPVPAILGFLDRRRISEDFNKLSID